MTNQEIVSKLWNLCNILRDDGITYHQYVTELTYILFLKMAKETKTEDAIPEQYRWDKLTSYSGIELKKFYKELLAYLGENTKGRVREIYQGASSNIDEPKNLEKIIKSIDELDWYSAKEEGLGNLYEGLLEKNANEKKSGAGQYFTPRVLIDVMTPPGIPWIRGRTSAVTPPIRPCPSSPAGPISISAKMPPRPSGKRPGRPWPSLAPPVPLT